MGQITVNVGSFDLTSHNGNTAYSSVRYFDIPANAGITGCAATFAQHVNTGSFQGKSFSLNGTQAHPNTPWPTSGISLNPALLATGQNTFRGAVKSQAGLSARWSIGDIYLTIDYTDVGGGEPPPNIGTITLNKSSMLAGETVAVSLSPCDNGIYRSIRVKWQGELITSLIIGGDVPSGGDYSYTFPLADCSRMPNDTSGSLTFEMETSVDIMVSRTMIILVPDSVVPTIGAFTATRDANGVDASITNYVQNYSKVSLAMGSVAGALGSSIQSYEITGAGFSVATSSAAFGPFAQIGDITFTAKVTDTRGRTATSTVTINVLSYGPPAFSNPEAWRSSDTGVKNQKGTYARLKSGVSYSDLSGQNAVTLKGRVYIKGGTAPAWTSMTPGAAWVTGGGLLLVTKTYIAQMIVQDKITSRTMDFTIPTKKTGISIMAGMLGAAIGKSAETPGILDVAWPIYTPNGRCFDERFDGLAWQFINVGSGGGRSLLINTGIVPTKNISGYLEIKGTSTAPSIAAFFTIIKFYYTHGTTSFYSAVQKDLGGALNTGSVGIYLGTIQILIPNVSYYPFFGVAAWSDGYRTPVTLSDSAAGVVPGTTTITFTKV